MSDEMTPGGHTLPGPIVLEELRLKMQVLKEMGLEAGEVKYLYRFETRTCSMGVDEFDNPLGTKLEVYLQRYRIIRETPKGVRIERWSGGSRLVLDGARKKYANRTVEEAKESYYARKAAYIRILRRKIAEAEAGVERVRFFKV